MEATEFFKNLGITMLIILLTGGFLYWCKYALNKMKPDLKYQLKYGVFKKKFNEKEVAMLLDYNQAGLDIDEVNKILLVTKGYSNKKAKELSWIYRKIKLKGGTKNE